MPTKRLLAISLLALTAGCDAEENQAKLFGTGEAQDVIARPTKVRAYRLADNSFYQPAVADYKTTAGPIDVDDAVARETSQLLVDVDSYLWDTAKGCEPIFGVRLEFTQGDKTADVFLCFECDILSVYYQGKPVGGEDFDRIQPQLVGIVKQIFPDDETIQSLKAR